jgi:tetratricopeptide (TPR) repeat protein
MRSRSPLLFLLVALLMLGAGCERAAGPRLIAEIDDADYTRGKNLLRQNRNQEAMAAFLKVIDKRSGDAPESHLEVGRLYQEQIKDPIQAIYHYRKYRELKPNAPQAELVRQLIHAATRDFARTLPAQPLENQVLRNDLLEVVERLQRENTQLRADLAAIGAGRPVSAVSLEDPGTSGPPFAFGPTSTPQLVTRGPAESTDAPQISQAPVQTMVPAPAPAQPPSAPAQTPAAGGRRHVVAQGESLYSIARRYYGTPTNARIAEIVAANRAVLPNGSTSLKIGMELRIP